MKGKIMTNLIATLTPIQDTYPAWIKAIVPSGTRTIDGAACYDYEDEEFTLDSYDSDYQLTNELTLQLREEHFITPEGLETHPALIWMCTGENCNLTADMARILSAKLLELADQLDGASLAS